MKILSAKQIREVDSHTIRHKPIPSIDLMECAATECYHWIISRFHKDTPFCIFCGTGNNGGDGLVVARLLDGKGYKVSVHIIRSSAKPSEDFLTNHRRLCKIKGVKITDISEAEKLPVIFKTALPHPAFSIIIDALFGSGLNRPLEGLMAEVAYFINKSGSRVIAIDIPSGLFSEENGEANRKTAVKATWTLTFQLPKISFMFSENADHVGEFHILNIGLDEEFIAQHKTSYNYITDDDLRPLLKPRAKFSHKGTYGHALLIAGSKGMMGAAVLTARACLRAGAGLLTVRAPACGYSVLQTAVPEALVQCDSSDGCFSGKIDPAIYTAIAAGPGIGRDEKTIQALKLLIQNTAAPLLLDADAINVIGENKTWLSFIPPGSIYTPHPREFERITEKVSDSWKKHLLQIAFAKKYKAYVVLKGAHTCIACPDGSCWFNSTGNPGMATGGSGDVLTGILLGLLAQGYSQKEACLLGVYLHGLAGDIAAAKKGHHALIASDITEYLGEAFLVLRKNQYLCF